MDCIFCKIANKEMDSTIVYEDDEIIAFEDVMPKAPTHMLIIPRKHIATMNDLEDEDIPMMGNMMQIAKDLAKKLGIAEEGYRVVMNCNRGGGQAVFHIHLHLLGGRALNWPPG